MKPKRPAGFLNVDLVIESSVTLEPLVLEFGKKVLVLYSGRVRGKRWLLNLETSRPTSTPDGAAWALCAVVEDFTRERDGTPRPVNPQTLAVYRKQHAAIAEVFETVDKDMNPEKFVERARQAQQQIREAEMEKNANK